MSGIAITFPSSPSEGQTHLAQNGFTYIYDSNKNRWKRGGEFVRSPKVLSYAGVAVTTTGSGITTGPTGALIYNVPGFVVPNSEVGVDTFKAYRAPESYPDYTEVQVSISSDFSSVAYAATFAGLTHTIPASTLSGNQTYYLRARQFVGSDAASAGVGAISGYSANIVSFATTSTFIDTPTIVSIAGDTDFPVYQIGYAGTTLPATVTYTGSGVNELERVDWRVTGPRIPSSTGDTALAEIGIGTHSSATLANALVLALPFSGATGVGITDDVNNAIRTASGASSGTTKTLTANGNAGIATIAGLALTSHFYDGAAYFDGSGDYVTTATNSDFGFGTGNWTIECWAYLRAYTGGKGILLDFNGTGRSNHHVTSSGYLGMYNGASDITTTYLVPLNSWQHLVWVKFNGILYMFANGTIVYAASDSRDYGSTRAPYIGSNDTGGSEYFNGYLQDFKIYKGLAKYTENFTPPLPTYGTISYTTGTTNTGINTTSFFESTGDTPTAEVAIGSSTAAQVASSLVLAMPMNKTFGFQDINVAIRGLTSGASAGTAKTVGLGTTSTANAPTHPIISATESKWYDGAAYFDGGDYLSSSDITDFNFGTGDFTIECWVYHSNSGSNEAYTDTGTNLNSAASGQWYFFKNSSDKVLWGQHGAGAIITSSDSISSKVWTHVAVSRTGSTVRMFINGIINGNATSSINFNNGGIFKIGVVSTPYYLNGYLQDLKIYKGFAKYTSDFTPPQPICGFSTDISTQTGFTTTTASGALLSSVVGLGSTSTLAFSADQTYAGITSITSSSGITTLPDPYAQNLVLALPLADITGVGNSFTNDRNTQIRSVSLVGAGIAKTVTNSGVTTVSVASTTQKWYGNAAYFDGNTTETSASRIEVASGLNFSQNFTVEMWFYNTIDQSSSVLFDCWNGQSSGTGWYVWLDSNTIDIVKDTSTYYYNSSTAVVSNNIWNHLSLVRDGNVFKVFLNGIFQYSFNITDNWTSTKCWIGSGQGNSSMNGFPGYIQDVRIYNSAKYTSDFTPPPPMFGDYTRSTPNKIIFTPASDYVLEAKNTSGIITSSYSATRQWGTKPEGGIYDPYAGNLVLAIPGGAVGGATTTYDVTGQIKFETPTATYVNAGIVTYSNSLGIGTYQNKSVTNYNTVTSTTTSKYYGRSLSFNGSNSYLTYAVGSDGIETGTVYTVEGWTYVNSAELTSNRYNFFFYSNTSSAAYSCAISKTRSGINNKIRVSFTVGGNASVSITSLNDCPSATWFHWAIVRNGSTGYFFLDGILQGTGTLSGTNAMETLWYVGGEPTATTQRLNGYINDIRIYKGIAKYTSNFTPPNQIYLS